MALLINAHVARLRRFQPFQPDSGELIFEQSDPREPRFDTTTLAHLSSVVEIPSVRLIVLTGDAGHGKTSLCARLLQTFGTDAVEAAALIRNRGDGAVPIATTPSGRPLRVVKDLSDMDFDRGAALLEQLLDLDDETVSIVCANEGRLRGAVASRPSDRLGVVVRTLESGMADGSLQSVDPAVHVLNLNYQSVAPDRRDGLVDWALRLWAADRRRWRTCGGCEAASKCPIQANHRQLADDRLGETRRRAIRTLFATAERLGAVITTRQALGVVSFAITGGLTCPEVHRRYRRRPTDDGWQYSFLYHQALFGDRLSRVERGHFPAIDALRQLDPGVVAKRSVDDHLEAIHDDLPFLPPVPAENEITPRSRRDAHRESEVLSELMRFLRRRDFFQPQASSLMGRMGLQAGDAFEAAISGAQADAVMIRDKLLKGLEAAQGVHRPGRPADFLVLDPAFVNHRSRAAVVASRIPSRAVNLVPQVEQWKLDFGREPELPEALDWLDRITYLRISGSGSQVKLPLNLFRFELLHRWAAGLSSRAQHEAHIRHLSAALSQLVMPADEFGEITVLVDGERRTLAIDVGDRVRSGEG